MTAHAASLAGQVAIITGGAVRLGRALALALADEGMRVVVHYGRSAAEAEQTLAELRSRGVDALAVQADLQEPAVAARAIFDQTIATFGRADVLVNNASIFEPGTLATTGDDAWNRHLAINLTAPFCLCREFVARLAAGAGGQIVNMADWRGERPLPGHLAYTISKSGLIALTKLLAQELAPRVRVNAIAPGPVLRPTSAGVEYEQRLAHDVPLRRGGSPADVVAALRYLLRAGFVTGEVLHVSGGEQL